MDDNTEHNQSGNPIPVDDDLKDHDQIEIIDHDPNIQAAGLIDADDNIENMHPMNNFPRPDMIGAIKIKDALFIGDELAAQDLEFVISNKVSHIVNCAGREIPNHWEPVGIEYLTFYWVDQDNQVLFDPDDNITNEILNFIDEALENGESCLVHSIRGQSRASVALSAYFMQKYRWSLYKTLEFLNSRRPNLEIRAAFVSQLAEFEEKLISQNRGPQTAHWNEVANNKIELDQNKFYHDEELILRNTFLNAQLCFSRTHNRQHGQNNDIKNGQNSQDIDILNNELNQNKIKWIDNNKNDKNILRTNHSDDDLVCKEKIEAIRSHKTIKDTKSIMKRKPAEKHSKSHSKMKSPQIQKNEINKKQDDKEPNLFHKINKDLSFEPLEKPTDHHKSIKQKMEPLIISDMQTLDDEESPKKADQNTEKENKERLIEKFNSGQTQNKIFVPKRGPSNHTAPEKNNNNIADNSNDATLK